VQGRFLNDWISSISAVELTEGVLGLIPDLIKRHPVRGSGAIHLASAFSIRDALQFGPACGPLTFATSDKQLKHATMAEGMDVFDPEEKN
jgi:hypothetical protein